MKPNKPHYVAFRVTRQTIKTNDVGVPYVADGWFVWGQYSGDYPDALAYNWAFLGEAFDEEEAKDIAFSWRELVMEKDRLKYCPIYNNGGYAYDGSY